MTAIWRRIGWIGRSMPAIAPICADHGPAAMTTVGVSIEPAFVTTRRTLPPVTPMPIAGVPVQQRRAEPSRVRHVALQQSVRVDETVERDTTYRR